MNDVAVKGPWPGDLLSRSELSSQLRNVISSMRSGGVFGIDAPFGHGKSYFVNGLGAELKAEGYTIAYFDAWKADLASHPLFLFVSSILAQLSDQGIQISAQQNLSDRVKRLASAVARVGLKSVLRAGDDDLDTLADPFVAEVDRLDFSKTGAAAEALALASEVETARAAFAEAVRVLLVEPNKKLPLLIVIDELDRARPDFAIEFLEALKFIFATEHVVFCVSVDRRNLMVSLRARFGKRYDVEQYLARLFSFWVRLANPPQNAEFMRNALIKLNLVADGVLTDDDSIDSGIRSMADLAVVGLGSRSANLRAMERCAERVNVCARALQPQKWASLTGLLCGFSVADRAFLDEYTSPKHDIHDRNPSSPFGPPGTPDPDFLDRLFRRARTTTHEAWTAAAMIAWALPEAEVQQRQFAITAVFNSEVASSAVQISRELSSRKRLHGQSAAEFIFSRVGWILG